MSWWSETEIKQKRTGFTLIELLVVTALLVLLVVGTSVLFVNVLNHKLQLNLNQEIKQEGEYIQEQISFFIRNAITILDPDVCDGSSSQVLMLKNFDGGATTFQAVNQAGSNRIASTSGILANPYHAFLSSSEYTINNLSFTCTMNQTDEINKRPKITVYFELMRLSAAVDNVNRSFKRVTLMRNPN